MSIQDYKRKDRKDKDITVSSLKTIMGPLAWLIDTYMEYILGIIIGTALGLAFALFMIMTHEGWVAI